MPVTIKPGIFNYKDSQGNFQTLEAIKGDSGAAITVQVEGTSPTIVCEDNHRYICGEVLSLNITLPDSGIVDVVFESGTTATVLTITPPTGVTMKWIGEDPENLEANKSYEINIMDGCRGMVVSWT